MQIAVLCEYNPFHLGHAYQISQIRARFGNDACITAILGGLFSQRGEPYIAPPYVRAEAAVRCGADLVLELPYPWSAAPAAYFARAGIEIAAACGADALAFGSECGDLDTLLAVRRNLDAPRLRARAEELLHSDEYASFGRIRAYARAYEELHGKCPLLQHPNDILALEYLAALDQLGVPILPLPLKRRGCRGESDGAGGYVPASALRSAYDKNGLAAIRKDVPPSAFAVFQTAAEKGWFGADGERLASAVFLALRTADSEVSAFSGGGVLGRLKKVAADVHTLEELFSRAASKRYTNAQLRRCALYTLLRTPPSAFDEPVRCIRVFAAAKRGREVLADVRRRHTICFLTKPAAYRRLPEEAAAQFESRFTVEYAYALTLPGSYNFLRQSPVFFETEEP